MFRCVFRRLTAWACVIAILISLWIVTPLGEVSRPLDMVLAVVFVLVLVAARALKPMTYGDYNKAMALWRAGRWSEASALYGPLIAQLRRGDSNEGRALLADALMKWAWALRQLEMVPEALSCCDELIAISGARVDVEGRKYWGLAMLSRAWAQAQLGQFELATRTSDAVVTRLSDAEVPDLRWAAATALLQEGVRKAERGEVANALAACDSVVRRFGKDLDQEMRAVVASAMYNRALTLGSVGEHSQSVSEYDRLINTYGTDLGAAETVSWAMVNKGSDLEAMGEFKVAVRTYGLMAERFSGSADPAMRAQVAKARFNKGHALAELGRSEEAIDELDGLLRDYGSESLASQVVCEATINKAVLLCQAGRLGRAQDACGEARRLVAGLPEAESRRLLQVVAGVEQDCLSQGNRAREQAP